MTFREKLGSFIAGKTSNRGAFGMPNGGQRSYDAAKFDRLTEDFNAPITTGDAELRTRIRVIRGRARELKRNCPYVSRYLNTIKNNVYDHHGITLQMQCGDWLKDPVTKKPVFKMDDTAIRMIEAAYAEWKRDPTVTHNMDANEAGRLALDCTATDGDSLCKMVVDTSVNKFGFALQLMEGDIIDDYRNDMLRSENPGQSPNQIRMGVEVNKDMAEVAYWLLKEYPGDSLWWHQQGYWSERHDAKDFLHLMKKDRITQVRGVSWFTNVMRDLKMLDGFDESAIVAARVGAAKMGFFVQKWAEGQGYAGAKDKDGNMMLDAEPGALEQLPYGTEFQSFNPEYPSAAYAPFVLQRLRRIASGLNQSYYSLANDLTAVNFSSIRAGLLEDREHFKALQSWWIARYEQPIFLKWLEVQLLSGNLNLPFSKLTKFSACEFRPRRWQWVDPMHDIQANILAVNNRLKSRDEIITESGDSEFTDIIDAIKREEAYAKAAGVDLNAMNVTGVNNIDSQASTLDENGTPVAGSDVSNTITTGSDDPEQQAANADSLQGTALNGAQVQALTQLIEAVSSGQVPIETAKAVVQASFPLIPEAEIEAMFIPLKGFKQPQKQEAKQPAQDAVSK